MPATLINIHLAADSAPPAGRSPAPIELYLVAIGIILPTTVDTKSNRDQKLSASTATSCRYHYYSINTNTSFLISIILTTLYARLEHDMSLTQWAPHEFRGRRSVTISR